MTLDQLHLFVLIAKSGSFSAAAREVRRAPSAVSTAIKNLEEEWGVLLFSRDGYKPELSLVGQSLFAEVESLIKASQSLEKHVQTMRSGIEPVVSISCNNLFPLQKIEGGLLQLQNEFPETAVNLSVDHMDDPIHKILNGKADISLTLKTPQYESALESFPIADLLLIAVTSPNYIPSPAASKLELARKTQIVVSSFSGKKDDQHGVVSTRQWMVGDFASKLSFLCQGLGYGYMPNYMIEGHLKDKRLVELKALRRIPIPMVAYRREGETLGKVRSLLWDLLKAC